MALPPTPVVLPMPCDLPPSALLRKYQGEEGGYADCYVTQVDGAVSQQAFVEAFYTTPLFKVERALLRWFGGCQANDFDAHQLAAGEAAKYAAWRVEARGVGQLLLADVMSGKTRSWLMSSPVDGSAGGPTRLYFGSAVVPRLNAKTGRKEMGSGFHLLLGFHRLYSRLLLAAARSKIVSGLRKAGVTA